ncbi:MAG: T9SS type A sorting domain-containing protein [Saprospiraceae bacterium]|nr:T9SS type A sorting domain-containing protein [Saprospiraceae bacterium]
MGARVARELRTVANGAHTVSQLAAPKHNYVRIARVGDVFTSSVSANGVTWTQVNTVTVAGLPSTLNVGFYVNSQLATAGTVEFGSAGVFSGAALISDIASRNGEVSAYAAISAYPNPANNELNINMGHLTGGKVQVTVMNSLGQVALQQNFDVVNEVERLDINKLSTGVYFLQVNTEAVQKIIVNK